MAMAEIDSSRPRLAASRIWRRTAAGLAIAIAVIPVFATTASAVVEDPDVDTSANYEYRVDPESNSVAVTVTLKVTADKPNRSTAAGTYQYYFEGHGLTIPLEAEDITVTNEAGSTLEWEVEQEYDWFQTIAFGFRRNIFHRQTATVIVKYNLVEDRENDLSLVRVNDAYAGLSVWTDPLLEAAEVTVITPPGFVSSIPGQVDPSDGTFSADIGDDEIRFEAESFDPERFWAVLSLSRPEMLIQEPLEVAGRDIIIQSWPGDTAWPAKAAKSLEDGLPLLLDSIDLEWPLQEDLTVAESFDPTLAGYGGWYDPTAAEISVGDALDDHLMMHELSHLWFNHDLFTDRWITEGLANTYAAEVVEEMGDDRPEPKRVSLLDASALPLATWRHRAGEPEVEQWAYPASWTVTDAILDEVGKDTLDATIAAAFNQQPSYPGDDATETNGSATTWKRYLDLLENADADGARRNEELQEIFLDWVMAETDADSDLLEQRAEARKRYFDLAERGDDWAAPFGVRSAMATWSFDNANTHMDDAEALLEQRDRVDQLVAPVNAALPRAVEESYESARGFNYSAAADHLAEAEVAAEQLRGSHDELHAATGIFERVGALGTGHDATLTSAADAFSEGDFDTVAQRTAELHTDIDGLARTGMIRSGIAALLFLVLPLLGGLLFWLGLRRRAKQHLVE